MRTLALLALLLTSAAAEARTVYLCVVGDSISAQVFLYPYGGVWPELIAQHQGGQNWGARNNARTSYTTTTIAPLFDKDCSGRGYTHVALFIGTNDVGDTSDSAATIYARWNAMALTAEAQGARVLGFTLAPRGLDSTWTAAKEQRRQALNALIAARGGTTIVVDTATVLLESVSFSTTAWASGTSYSSGTSRANGGNVYQVVSSGTCTSAGSGGPSGTSSSITDNTCTWRFVGAVWQGATAYSLSARVVNGGALYIVATAGTSAGSGGPSGTGTDITDGSVHWTHLPALSTACGGTYDGVHPTVPPIPNSTGQACIRAAVETAVANAGGW